MDLGFYGFIGVALAWQVLFLIIARDPVRYRGAIWAAILEKLSFAGATITLFTRGRIAAPILAFGLIDLLLGLLFIVALTRVPREPIRGDRTNRTSRDQEMPSSRLPPELLISKENVHATEQAPKAFHRRAR